MTGIKHYLIFGILLVQFPNYTKKWQGSDLPGHSYATFEDFNGKQDFEIKIAKGESFTLKYSTALNKGQLALEIRSSDEIILSKQLKGSETGEVTVPNLRMKKYKFIFRAKHADGSYNITYKKN